MAIDFKVLAQCCGNNAVKGTRAFDHSIVQSGRERAWDNHVQIRHEITFVWFSVAWVASSSRDAGAVLISIVPPVSLGESSGQMHLRCRALGKGVRCRWMRLLKADLLSRRQVAHILRKDLREGPEEKQQVPPLRCASVGMTILWQGD